MTETQESLSAFSTPDTSSQSTPQKQDETCEQPEQSNAGKTTTPTPTTSPQSKTPLTDLYEDVEAHIEEAYPAFLRDQAIVTPPDPENQRYRTNGIPTAVDALPDTIGQWKLVTHDATHVSYLADGPAYDTEYGKGGSLVRFKLSLNDRGANRDDKYHLRTEKVVGYTNGEKIRSHTPDDESPMLGIRGHSVGDNPGDFSVLGGTKRKFGDPRDGIIDLIALLHHLPVPIRNYLPDTEDTPWEPVKHDLVSATWSTDAPDCVPKEDLILRLSTNQLRLTASDPSDSLPQKDTTTAPLVDPSFPDGLTGWLESKSAYTTVSSIRAVSAILTEDLTTVAEKSQLNTSESL
ncbi:hypothetical protein [Halorubrum sp. AJ67]|uniref:hypothetical protein n=1 Tax=Halorubrum sp. AJ67 TaxID=1173487 RepID=UPI0003DC78FC|nr:hypothetical protein [Halorubrum sp. AJ67]CDK38049.1 hypothetical protein BN903_249 [Halorubrum sp. AJ67]